MIFSFSVIFLSSKENKDWLPWNSYCEIDSKYEGCTHLLHPFVLHHCRNHPFATIFSSSTLFDFYFEKYKLRIAMKNINLDVLKGTEQYLSSFTALHIWRTHFDFIMIKANKNLRIFFQHFCPHLSSTFFFFVLHLLCYQSI